jgi:hypothetical protein
LLSAITPFTALVAARAARSCASEPSAVAIWMTAGFIKRAMAEAEPLATMFRPSLRSSSQVKIAPTCCCGYSLGIWWHSCSRVRVSRNPRCLFR